MAVHPVRSRKRLRLIENGIPHGRVRPPSMFAPTAVTPANPPRMDGPGHDHVHSLSELDWIETLVSEQRVVWREFLEPGLVDSLRGEVYALRATSAMQRARIGRAQGRRRDVATRGDWIHWLDGASEAQRALLSRLDMLRVQVNRSLLLGLFDTEAHFALYPPGTQYVRHLDAFQSRNHRRLSLVVYLNRHWRTRDGGELAIYDPQGVERERIRPAAGTLVVFLSRRVSHAVLPTRRWRASIAAWMRVRDTESPLNALD